MLTTCIHCKKEFHAKPYVVKSGRKKYCSKECKNNYIKSKRISYICKGCGKTFYRPASSKNANLYCSKDCELKHRSTNKTCIHCGKLFKVPISDTHTFCSRKCYLDHKTVTKICPCCGAFFTVPKSNANRYTTCSIECKKKYKTGERSTNWKGGKIKITCEICGDEFEAYPSREKYRKVCHNPVCLKEIRSKNLKGDKCHWWQGGISHTKYCEKFDNHFKERVRAFFNYTCLICGAPQGTEKLGVHHIHYNKRACCDNSPRLFAPVCRSCHAKTNSHREYWEDVLYNKIMLEYDGKSYLSKEDMRIRKKE